MRTFERKSRLRVTSAGASLSHPVQLGPPLRTKAEIKEWIEAESICSAGVTKPFGIGM
jgi:hypothetical protein